MGRRLLEDDEDTPTVTFPDDYPNSVRHFLLIGFLGMFIGAIVFFYMGISRKVNTVMHVLTFFIAAVSACAYYAEWAGLGVEYKTTDTTPRVIFWAHYLDWVITGPVCYASCARFFLIFYYQILFETSRRCIGSIFFLTEIERQLRELGRGALVKLGK